MNESEAELELLAKLEEQNRTLMADAKAVASLNPRRRNGSISSSFSTESSADTTKSDAPTFSSMRSSLSATISLPPVLLWGHNVSPQSASISDQWANVVNNWEQFSKKRSFVADLIRKGLPDNFRPVVWQLFTGAFDSDSRKLYDGYLAVESPVEKAIRRDITRTFPKHDFFKDEDGYGQECLYRVIKAYSVHDKEVGYCQGSGFIAGLLLMQLPEADAFAVLVQLMNEYRLREMYKPSMMELGVYMYQTERLLAEHLPELHAHFVAHSFGPSLYASAWFLTLFSTVLPIPMATRVMDYFIAEGFNFIFKLVLAMLKFSSCKLLNCDLESMVAFLQHDGPASWERNSAAIFESANSFKLNTKRMKKLEKEYLQMRSQEREDRTELRRLRAENGVLVQRLARLEEECSSMAERLIQSQLVRAQEAETMLALRCDLSVLKRTMAENDVHRSSLNTNGGFAIVNGDFATSIMNSSDTTALDPADSVQKEVDLPLETSASTSVANSFGHSAVSVSDESASVCPPLSPPDVKHVSDTKVLEAIPDPARGVSGSATQDDRRDTLPRQQHFFRNRMPSRENAPTTTDVCHLYTDLSMCCVREAEARTELLDLKARYYALEQLKCDLAARSSDQIAALKDELFGSKIREAEALTRLEEFRSRLVEIESAWQDHYTRCKTICPVQEAKRATIKLSPIVSSNFNDYPRKLSDMVVEARYADQVATLKRQVNELAIQREVADRRADRLDQRVTELVEARAAADSRCRELHLELKQAVQMCADMEAKRRTDGVMWRSREMELTAQLAECRHHQIQMECKYEGLLATKSLQSNGPMSPQEDTDACYDVNLKSINLKPTSIPRQHLIGVQTDSYLCDASVMESEDSIPPHRCDPARSSECPLPSSPDRLNKDITAVWKDLPPTVMTDSIGPLEDLCLNPDDPFITSVYIGTENT